MIPGMNPRKMAQMMKRMGINQQEIPATKVIIETEDSRIIIDNPQVSKVNAMGQETYQVVGQAREEAIDNSPEINEEDIKTVMAQTGANHDESLDAITKHDGDLAGAILSLSKEE